VEYCSLGPLNLQNQQSL